MATKAQLLALQEENEKLKQRNRVLEAALASTMPGENLLSFDDCWRAVDPIWYITTSNLITRESKSNSHSFDAFTNNLPTKEHCQWIQELIKLQVLATALNDGWVYGETNYDGYTFEYGGTILIRKPQLVRTGITHYTNVMFRSEKAAHKALDILGEESIRKALRLYVH
jgi:hypothetical protein